MTGDSTLDDFLEGLADGDEDEADGTDPRGDSERGTPGDSGLSTYAWGAYTCSRCDADVGRVWRDDDDGFVCSACKSW